MVHKKSSQTHPLTTNRLKYIFFNKLTNFCLSLVTKLSCLFALCLTAASHDTPSPVPGSPCSSIKFHQMHKTFFLLQFLCVPASTSKHNDNTEFTSGKTLFLSPYWKALTSLALPKILTLNHKSGKILTAIA